MPDEPIVHDFQSIQNAFQTVQQFGEQVKKLGTTLTGVHEQLAEHCSGDESGVGAVVAGAAKDVTGVAGKVFTEGGRVLSEMGTRGKTNGQRTENTDRTIADTLNGIHDENYGGGGGGSGSEPGGGRTEPASSSEPHEPGYTDPNGEHEPGSGDGNDGKCTGGDPVDMVSGQMITSKHDLELPGLLPLLLRRAYASGYAYGRLFGPGWSSTLDQRLVVDEDGIHFAGDDAQLLHYPVPTQPGQRVAPAQGARWPLTWDRAADELRIEEPRTGRTRHFGALDPVRDSEREVRLLTAISDRNGHRIDFLRDADGLPTEVRHSGGYRVAVDTVYTAAGFRVEGLRLLGAATGGGADSAAGVGASAADDGRGTTVVSYQYDPSGRLVGVVNSSGLPYVYEYGASDRITAWIDRTGHRYDYEYDDGGRVVRGTGDGGYMSTTFAYDPANRINVATDSLGYPTEYHYDEHGHVIRIVDPLGAGLDFELDRRGRLLAATDRLDRTTSYELDERGDAVQITAPDGAVTTASYDEAGQPTLVTMPDGARWLHEYDERGNLVALTDPVGARTVFEHDDRGAPTALTDALGNRTAYETDAAGLTVSTTAPDGGTVRAERDAFGRVVAVTDPLGGVERLEWDIEGQLRSRTAPDGTREAWEYDAVGNLIRHTDQAGNTVRYELGPFNQVLAHTQPDGARYAFVHDTELRLISVNGPQQLSWTYAYDGADNLVGETDFNGRTLTYRYDAAGQLLQKTTGAGQSLVFEYDQAGRIVRRAGSGSEAGPDAGPEAAGAIADDEALFRYDRAGRLSWARSGDLVLEYTRDVAGRVVAETVGGRTVASEYDLLGRRITRSTPSGARSAWTYDSADRPAALDCGAGSLVFQYDAAGRETTRFLGSGAALTQTWDAADRLTGQAIWAYGLDATTADATTADAGAYAARQQRTYTYRPDGYPLAITDLLNGDRRFELGPVGRVTAVHAQDRSEQYAYDAAGNVTAASYPAENGDAVGDRRFEGTLLRSAGRTVYEHDGQGRLTRMLRRTLSGKRLEWAFTWDADDRLVLAATPDRGTWRYRYDPLGRRVGKECLGDDGEPVLELAFTWDDNVLAEQSVELDGATSVVTWDWEPGSYRCAAQTERVAPHERAGDGAGEGPRDDADESAHDPRLAAQFYAVVCDLIGTPREMVGPDGRIRWHSAESLWGVRTPGEPVPGCPLGFPGQYRDDETGLDYNFFRYYDPQSARYLTPDPLGLGPSPNQYGYVSNPLAWIDPYGLVAGSGADGGWYGALTPAGSGYEVNHIPAKASYKNLGIGSLSMHSGPAIRMDYADHRNVTSTGYDAAARAWHARQRSLISQGKMTQAMQMDLDDIRARYGPKYDTQIKEMIASIPHNKGLQQYLKDNGWKIQTCKLK